MSLLRPYATAEINTNFMARNLGIAEDIVKTGHLYDAMADPGGYVESRKNRLEKIAENLAKDYKIKYKELSDQGLSDRKIVKLLNEITESLYSMEKAIIDNEYAESDQLLFKKFQAKPYSDKIPKGTPKTLEAAKKRSDKLGLKQGKMAELMEKLEKIEAAALESGH